MKFSQLSPKERDAIKEAFPDNDDIEDLPEICLLGDVQKQGKTITVEVKDADNRHVLGTATLKKNGEAYSFPSFRPV